MGTGIAAGIKLRRGYPRVQAHVGAFGKPPEDDATSGGPGSSGGPTVGVFMPKPPVRGYSIPRARARIGSQVPCTACWFRTTTSCTWSTVPIGAQLFTPDGKYLKEMFVNRAGLGRGIGVRAGVLARQGAVPVPVGLWQFAHRGGRPQDSRNPYLPGKRSAAPGDFQACIILRSTPWATCTRPSSAGRLRPEVQLQWHVVNGAAVRIDGR